MICQSIFTFRQFSYSATPGCELYDFLYMWIADEFGFCGRGWMWEVCTAFPCAALPVRCAGQRARNLVCLRMGWETLRFLSILERERFTGLNPSYAGWAHLEEGERCEPFPWSDECEC